MTIERSKKTVLLLALCQALAMTGNIILFTTAALIGYSLASDKSLATLPLALLQLATMVATIPASLLMKRIGRQLGFLIGVCIGLVGALLGFYALNASSFSLFCLANMLFGVFNGFVGFYRFAAAEVAAEKFRAQAISLVIAGGVVAALVGPQLAKQSKDWLQPVVFTGSMAAIVGIQLLSLLMLLKIKLPRLDQSKQQEKGRSLLVIMRQPVFIVAVLNSMIGYGVMSLVMTATPLAMVANHHSFDAAASVIEWHMLGMFAPSFITGSLITHFGLLNIIISGSILSLLCLAINLLGMSFWNYLIGLLLLGVGWNFLFIGSTTLLTQAYASAEKAKTQAMHDFMMFGFVAITTFLSGRLFDGLGWQAVNSAGIIPVVLASSAAIWLRFSSNNAVVKND